MCHSGQTKRKLCQKSQKQYLFFLIQSLKRTSNSWETSKWRISTIMKLLNWSTKFLKLVKKLPLKQKSKIGASLSKWKSTSKWLPARSLKRNCEELLLSINLLKERFNFTKKNKPMTSLKMGHFANGLNKKSFSISYSPTIILNSSKNPLNSSSIFIKGIIRWKSISKWSGSTERENMKPLLKKSTILLQKFPPTTETNNSLSSFLKSTSPKLIKIHGIKNTLKWSKIIRSVLCIS